MYNDACGGASRAKKFENGNGMDFSLSLLGYCPLGAPSPLKQLVSAARVSVPAPGQQRPQPSVQWRLARGEQLERASARHLLDMRRRRWRRWYTHSRTSNSLDFVTTSTSTVKTERGLFFGGQRVWGNDDIIHAFAAPSWTYVSGSR